MKIGDIGPLKIGLENELESGMTRLYTAYGYPLIELYTPVNIEGNVIWDDKELEELAADLLKLWNSV